MNNLLNLYPHNLEGYDEAKKAYQEGKKIVSEVRATGTGKSYINLQLALDNKAKKVIYIVPSLSIMEHLKEIIQESDNIRLDDFSHVEFRTFQSFINMSREELENLECDFLIVDEYHHLNGPVWESRIKEIIETHEDMQVFGTTAYTVVSRGTSYERDMALEDGEEVFSNSVVNRYDLCDAMIDGVLPKPIYKSAYIQFSSLIGQIEEQIEENNLTKEEYKKHQDYLSDMKRRIHEAPSIADVLKKSLKPNGKYYYFCPVYSQEGVNDIKAIKQQLLEYLGGKYKEEDIVFYTTTSEMGEEGKKNRDAFYHDRTLDGKDCSNKLRIMFSINQYNEGVHAPGVDGIIEGRKTKSDIVFFEHIGRALAVRGDMEKRYQELEHYSSLELEKMCQERDIFLKENLSKEEMIEKLLSPVIIDLTCNYEYIKELEDNLKKELEDNLKNRLKEKPKRKNYSYQRRRLTDASFDIEIENIDLFQTLMDLKNRLSHSWERMYEYACQYYEHHGNLEVPLRFKTNNGFEYDKDGKINLGMWIANQRIRLQPESERGRALLKIGMRFESKISTFSWEEMYEYACQYYEHHGNLEIPYKFKTSNGFEYEKDGKINLGRWITHQRRNVLPESERGRSLLKIGMRFESKISTFSWEEMYEYACQYYEHHGNLEIPQSFKTNNGFEYEKDGKVTLGRWIAKQRIKLQPESERGRSLLKIGMRFESKISTFSWEEMYEYACKYYEHHGNLEVPFSFKTNNGFEYDKNGKINLGAWIATQRRNVLPESERGKALLKIGMRFENKINILSWEDMYEYACQYYKHHGNLEVPSKFKTNNGFEYEKDGKVNLGTWLVTQRKRINPESEEGRLLLSIGMRFENKKCMMSWMEMYGYACKYYEHHGNLEVPSKFKTNNGFEYEKDGKVNLGTWLVTQKQDYYQQKELSEERILLLEQIGINWLSKKVDDKLQKEEITEKNIKKKQIELLNRTKSFLTHIQNRNIESMQDIHQINEQFTNELNRKSR